MPTGPELGAKDWNRLNRLLEAALAIEDAPAREEWLQALPSEDADLLPLLRKLLDEPADRHGSDTVSSPALAVPADERPGDLFGPYRLVRELGKGGMGTVWLAERSDGSFQRKVALKLPRSEWVDRGLAQRFARERAVLATLGHPNIAQMLDAGSSPSGRPYLALEYVEGVSIDVWCEQQSLGLVAKLRLFAEVIRAVGHAHARLVVHRDLKPSNVLVTSDGRSKLLDFGIAKLLAAETGDAEETELTRLAGRALTPRYGAPEQILGQPVSTATDIYALGVMLFELLTHERPYAFGRTEPISRGALEDRIVTVDVRAPSDAATEPGLKRMLRGDLDAIVLKALKKKPAQRYETASAFADDIDRYLNHLPVRAQRDSRAYRWQRFIVRNRLVVGASAAVVAALAVGFSTALWQARAARAEAARSNTIKEFVLSIIQQADPVASQQTRAADIALLSAAEQRVAGELSDRPELQLQIRLAIAKAYRNRGDWEQARNVLRSAVSEAKERVPPDNIDFLQARFMLTEWPILDADKSKEEIDAVIERLRKLGKPAIPALIDGLLARASVSSLEAAHADAKDAASLAEKTFEPSHPKVISARTAVAATYPDYARDEDALAVIEPTYRRAIENTKLGPGHPVRLGAQIQYGYRLAALGRYDEGLPLLEQAVQTARSHHGSDSNTLINALGLLSWTIARKGDIREALELHRQRHAIIAAREPRESLRRIRSAMWLVTYMSWLGRSQEALPVIDELMAIPEDVTASESMRNLRKEQAFDLRATLSSSLANLGRLDEARAVALALLRDYENFEPEDPEMLIHAQSLFVRATRRLGRANEVEELAERMAESARREPRADHKLSYIGELAAVKLALGKLPETLVLADEAIYVQTRTSWLPAEARVRKIRGETLLKLGRVKEASAQLEEVDAYWRDFDPDHPRAAEAAWWFGQALVAAGDSRRGNAVLAEARPRLGVSWLPELRPLATAPAPYQAPAPAKLARD